MFCPIDNETLVMANRNGVEIDYCPKCRGVWLDRGELDKIIDRALGGAEAAPAPAPAPRAAAPLYHPEPQRHPESRDPGRRSRDDDDDDDYRRGYKKRRRESFLGDLFDF